MIGFITGSIDNPWTDYEVCDFEKNGSQRDTIQYNSYYNWRIKLTDKNVFLCSLKTKENNYKNIYLFAVTRNLFYFGIFVPQLEILKQLKGNEKLKHVLASLSLTSICCDSENHAVQLNQTVCSLDTSCLLVKVNAPIDSFLFPRNGKISNNEIRSKYILLNNLYFQIDKEYEVLGEIIEKYNSECGRKYKEIEEKLKRILIRKSICFALGGFTAGLSLGLDVLFGLGDVADIYDYIDAADIISGTMDVIDAADIPDFGILDIDDMTDMNIMNISESDSLLVDNYNVSFGANKTIGDTVYLDKGHTITLEPAGGGLGKETPEVYVKSGTNTRYILDGDLPRKIDGFTQVAYHGRKWIIK